MNTACLVPLCAFNDDLRHPVPTLAETADDLVLACDTLTQVVDRNWASHGWTISGAASGNCIVSNYADAIGSFTVVPGPTSVFLTVPIEETLLPAITPQPNFAVENRDDLLNFGGTYPLQTAVHDSVFPFGLVGGDSVGGVLLQATATVLISLSPFAFKYAGQYYATASVQVSVTFGVGGVDVILDESTSIQQGPDAVGYNFAYFPPASESDVSAGSVSAYDYTKSRDWGSFTLYSPDTAATQTLNLNLRRRYA